MLCELNADDKARASEKSWHYELPLTEHLLERGLAYIFNDPQSMPCLASHAQACPMLLSPALSWPRVGLGPLTTGAHTARWARAWNREEGGRVLSRVQPAAVKRSSGLGLKG